MNSHSDTEEVVVLDKVRAVQCALALSLNAAGGKIMTAATEKFIAYSARHMNCASEGYVVLRERDRIVASKLLVRPIIEIALRLLAVHAEPSLLHRIAYTERIEGNKRLRALSKRTGGAFDETGDVQRGTIFASTPQASSRDANCAMSPFR